MSAARSVGETLLVVVSPTALALDGESVRVARDVLGAACTVKLAFPGSLAELERTLSRRGARRLVVIGDDRALHQVVQLLHQHSELGAGPIGMIPVGKGEKVALARSLGAAGRPVDAARAVLHGCERSLGLLVDESGGVVLGGLRIPGRDAPAAGFGAGPEPGPQGAATALPEQGANALPRRVAPTDGRSLRANKVAAVRGLQLPSACLEWGDRLGRAARGVAAQFRSGRPEPGQALRVEADGRLLADLDQPVRMVAAWNAGTRGGAASVHGAAGAAAGAGAGAGADGGLMEVLVSGRTASGGPVRARAQRITVTTGGPAATFTYEADAAMAGPVQQRTWTVQPAVWRLTVPPAA